VPGTVSNNKFRLMRFYHFLDLIKDIRPVGRALKVLDIGGEQQYWADKVELVAQPIEITLVNLWPQNELRPGFVSAIGDACSMIEFADNSFDVVHSNSVIEHVGQWPRMRAMANEVRRLAPAYFIQTPYFWFPIEPHFRSLAFHWLPESVRVRMILAKKRGFVGRAESMDLAMQAIQGSTLLDKKMFSELFPDATILSERVFGLTKSLIAVRKLR